MSHVSQTNAVDLKVMNARNVQMVIMKLEMLVLVQASACLLVLLDILQTSSSTNALKEVKVLITLECDGRCDTCYDVGNLCCN